MKFNSNVLSLAALTAFLPTAANGAQIGLCDDQAKCIDFTIKKSPRSTCSDKLEVDCAIEVCMILDTGMEGCGREGEAISHLCAASDGQGCRAVDQEGIAETGKGESTDCTDIYFDGQCTPDDPLEPEKNPFKVKMCQEGKPGEKLYWALKDSDEFDTGPYDYTGFFNVKEYNNENEEGLCMPEVQCLGGGYECAYPRIREDMISKTRTWVYTIPAKDGTICDYCVSPPPPTPTPPVEPTPTPPLPTPSRSETNGDPHCKYRIHKERPPLSSWFM